MLQIDYSMHKQKMHHSYNSQRKFGKQRNALQEVYLRVGELAEMSKILIKGRLERKLYLSPRFINGAKEDEDI